MPERGSPPLQVVGEPGTLSLVQRAVEMRPPAGKQVLFFSVEPHHQMVGKYSHTVPSPHKDIYPQWTTIAHNMRPDDLHSVPIHDALTPVPDITRFAGILGGGAGAMVTDGGPWLERFQSVLKTIPDAEVATLLTCFSMQAYVQALDGRVKNNDSGRRKFGVGRYERTSAGRNHWLLKDLGDKFSAFRSHSQDVDPASLPDGVEVLAVDAQDGTVAAIGQGDWIAGIQFHNDLSVQAMIGLSMSRLGEIAEAGMTHGQFIQGVREAEPVVMHTRRKLNANFHQRMHTRHQMVGR